MTARTPDSSYFEAMTNIMFTGHWLTDHVTAALKPFEISEPQFNVLRLLDDAGDVPLAQQDIQGRMIQRSSNVSRILDRLIDRGFVTRTINLENRRKMDIVLTTEGRKFVRKAARDVLEFHATLQANLTDNESRQLTRLLKKFRG